MRPSPWRPARSWNFPSEAVEDKRPPTEVPLWWLFAGALALGTFIRFYHLSDPQLWLDEILRLVRFSNETVWENFLDLKRDVAAVPLDYLVQSLFTHLWGLSEFSARFHAALFGALAIPLSYWVAAALLDRKVAVFSAAAIAVYPLHIFYSREAANYSLFHLLTLLAYGLLIRAVKTGRVSSWVLFALATVANLYTNFLALVFLPAQVAGLWCYSAGARAEAFRKNLRHYCLAGGAAVVLFLPWALWTLGGAAQNYPSLLEAGLPARILQELGGSYPFSFLMLVLAGSGLYWLWTTHRRPAALLLITWFVIPLAQTLLLDGWQAYFFAVRQILPATPAVMIAVGCGVARLQEGSRHPLRWVLPLGLVAALGTGTVALSRRNSPNDWKALDRYLSANLRAEDRVLAPNIERVVSFIYPCLDHEPLNIEDRGTLRLALSQGRVHIVATRFATESQREQLEKLTSGLAPIFEAQGIAVFVLP